MSVCQRCPAFLRWVKSAATGRLMPLDINAVDDGNVVVVNGRAHVYRTAAEARAAHPNNPKLQLFKSHFSTCPRAADFRRKNL